MFLAVEGPRAEDIEEARAMLNADEAQLVLKQEGLKDAELYAPTDGIIRNRILEPGDMASPQIPVLTLALTNPVWVRAYAPESVETNALVLRGVASRICRALPGEQPTKGQLTEMIFDALSN